MGTGTPATVKESLTHLKFMLY